jgi:hypothetical protein
VEQQVGAPSPSSKYGELQRRRAKVRPRILFSARSQQELDAIVVAAVGGGVQRRPPEVPSDARIGAGLQKHEDARSVTALRRQIQGRHSRTISPIHVRILQAKQRGNALHIAIARRRVQRRASAGEREFRLGAIVNQQLDARQVAVLGRQVQR